MLIPFLFRAGVQRLARRRDRCNQISPSATAGGASYNRQVATTDVLIAGAGIIGLSTALELAASGLRVTVVERGRAMCESSWAAAGMLAAADPENPPELRPLAQLSIQLYPEFLHKVEELSGLRVPIRTMGALQASAPGKTFRNAAALSPGEVEDRVPGLQAEDRAFLWLEEQSFDPRDLCAALPNAARAAGVTLVEQISVTDVRSNGSGVQVETSAGFYSAANFLNCCGAWSASICALPIEPRKGQILAVRLPESVCLNYVVRTPEFYLVPRGDGRVIVGATVERAGFDKSVHEDALQSLLERAADLWPSIKNSEIVESWAGLRPTCSDSLPVIDSCGPDHCWTATGHFRNGILLAPATARVLRQRVLGESTDVDLSPFHRGRFMRAAVQSTR